MIQRHQQENDLYMTMMTTAGYEDAGSITSTVSTTNTTVTTSRGSISSSSSSGKKSRRKSKSKKSSTNLTAATNVIITKPAQFDILCGKDKTYNKHAGNQVFRAMIETWVKTYQQATTKQEKMRITKQIVHSLQDQFESRFLKPAAAAAENNGVVECWIEISNQVARDKVSHALRFAAKQHQTLVKNVVQAKKLQLPKLQQMRYVPPHRHAAVTQSPILEKKPTVALVDEEGVDSLFQLQQAILLGSLNANKNKNNNSNNTNSGHQHQQRQNAAQEEQHHTEEPEFNTLRSEDLNAILNEPLELENDYDTLMSLSR